MGAVDPHLDPVPVEDLPVLIVDAEVVKLGGGEAGAATWWMIDKSDKENW